ncbi:SusC/RagA family TonB-linked outer membrane protein [Chitinophaga filiformis]|uniref:SusC/RagA family TonB-linked outer membrane protein n=1 Tax=Chitinophaga filiformis TaxID=104663 RepID=A0ABY4I1R0_CHIFI|nr:SusC/RagA family TonB-linked outer membrane protein [Chitinophaga filiformis]UPK69747.1 SusC/RagA family TonB-linked outer membrane protein [Chitinophaga filiformis]
MGMPKPALLCQLLLLLFTCCLCQVKGQDHARPKVTIVGKGLSLRYIFSQIEKQSPYYFSYDPAIVNIHQVLDADFRNAAVPDVLNAVLKGLYTWKLDDRSINVMKAPLAIGPRMQPMELPDTPALIMGRVLDETVIIGYGTTTPRFNTGNVTTVKGDFIAGQSGTNLLMALQGRVPGMLITQTGGVPGMAMKVQIRGQNSLVNGTQPLFIVDGIPYNPVLNGGLGSQIWGDKASAFNFINAEDVESIEVLKDADATAIYGSRGANGVVLISTRKGQPGKTQLNVNVSRGFGKTSRKVKLLNTQQYIAMRREAFRNDGVRPTERNAPDLLKWDTTRYTDWQQQLTGGTASVTNAQASVSGGNKHFLYLLSGHYRRESTVFPGPFGDTRGGIHFSTSTTTANQRFHATFTGSFLADKTSLPGLDLTSQIMLPPNAPAVYLEDGSLNYGWLNPYIALVGPLFDAHVKNLLGNLGLQYRLLPGLVFKTAMGYNWLIGRSETILPIEMYAPDLRKGKTGSLHKYDYDAISRIIEPQLNYELQAGALRLQIVLGGTVQGYDETRENINGDGFKDDRLIRNIRYADTVYGATEGAAYRYAALFGRTGLNWKNRYLLNLSLRRDGSSRFGPRKQYAVFAAAGAGWIFTEEPFMCHLRQVLSFGKLRMSYGTTGNDQIGDYQYLDKYEEVTGTYQGATGLKTSRLFNADFAWELTQKSEAGLELGFLDDKILFSASHFIYRSSNQLVAYPLPDITGAGSIIGNLPAVIRNTGWEFTLSTRCIRKQQFEWASAFNISFGHNKLVHYPDPTIPFLGGNGFVEGEPLSQRYVATSMGVDPATGSYLFADANQKPVPAEKAAERLSVNSVPVFFGGWQNSMRLGRFQLEVLLQFTKQEGINTTFDPSYMPGFQQNQYTEVLSRWQKPGDITDRQRYTQNGALREGYKKAIKSDLGYEDASFVRCRYVEAAWLLPENMQQKLRLHDSRVYLQAQNLFTLSSYKGLDPETQSRTAIPPLRVLSAGLKISL